MLVYLASAMKELGQLATAAELYERVLAIEPDLAEVHYNLGNIRQAQERTAEAEVCYRKALALAPGLAFAHYNLGNIYLDQGRLETAVDCFKQAILNAPGHAPSYNNLGNALVHQGNLPMAIQCYRAALDNQPDYREAMYNLGNAFYQQGEFASAIPWFEQAGIRDAQARALYCYYKCRRFAEFETRLARHCQTADHHSPQVATLAAHHAINFGAQNRYRFCPQPFDFVYHEPEPRLTEGATLRASLLNALTGGGIEERVQGRLHQGVQSAGNLFHREESCFRELAGLVRSHFRQYRERHAGADCELIRAFPEALSFESAWYIRMQRGGHLDAHIHEGGWVSGVVYLALPQPERDPSEGCLELGLHGDDYPLAPDAGEFPTRVVPIAVGDIVLFPANLFHRTIPFSVDEERICIAFDLQPAGGVR